MMKRLIPAILLLLALSAAPIVAQSNAELKEQVRNTERAFAKTMADRDHAAFVGFLSEETVKSHVSNIFGKLEISGRVQAVVFAYEAGLVRPGQAGNPS